MTADSVTEVEVGMRSDMMIVLFFFRLVVFVSLFCCDVKLLLMMSVERERRGDARLCEECVECRHR